jgi:hypothetical protein
MANDRLRREAEQRAKQMQYDYDERKSMAQSMNDIYAQMATSTTSASGSLSYTDLLRAYDQMLNPAIKRNEYRKMDKLKDWQYDYNRLGFKRKNDFIGDSVLHQIGIHQDTELTDDMITSAFVNEKLRICKEENCSGEEACSIMSGCRPSQKVYFSSLSGAAGSGGGGAGGASWYGGY